MQHMNQYQHQYHNPNYYGKGGGGKPYGEPVTHNVYNIQRHYDQPAYTRPWKGAGKGHRHQFPQPQAYSKGINKN